MSVDLIKIVAENLTYLKEKNNVTNVEIADKLGVSKSAVSEWINQKKMPRRGAILELANFFKVTTNEILTPLGEQNQRDLNRFIDIAKTYKGNELTPRDKKFIKKLLDGIFE
ncbi:MAG: helix-turn-helix domain-containing protein [Streptococcaceae bacterium]|nr:helix-turn-helix domain-containing protein [Streptococcaceae bacterium]MCL2680868.1 helix-turn-helix domain-containing protein [Streptococcaceae bacterium]MCL2858065.1 helix-turn-helix domain-containing protein [Streptococcaceae bacterium]